MSNFSRTSFSSSDDTSQWFSVLISHLVELTSQPIIPTLIPWEPCFINEGEAIDVTWSCANLTVPIDYRNATSNLTTNVGIVRGRPNELDVPQGALFNNPGGPCEGYFFAKICPV
jgi:hypothetical protein